MHYLKRNAKLGILAFLIFILCLTVSVSSLAKTEVYFSLSDNPQKEIIKNINQAQGFINIAMHVLTDKELALPLIEAQTVNINTASPSMSFPYSSLSFPPLFLSFPRKRESIPSLVVTRNPLSVIANRAATRQSQPPSIGRNGKSRG